MLILVLSDIHGNFQALQKVIKESRQFKWKQLWFLGDLGGYGPRPEECFNLLRKENAVILPGNHDLYLSGQLPGSFFSSESIRSLIQNRGLLKRNTLELIKAIPLKQKRKGFTLVHGSPENPATDYILTDDDASNAFSSFDGRGCFFGHTHIQEYFIQGARGCERFRPSNGDVLSYRKKRILINPGSIGQPRDRDPRAAWCILDTRRKEVRFFRSEYDIKATQKEMRKLGSSDFLIERLEKGI